MTMMIMLTNDDDNDILSKQLHPQFFKTCALLVQWWLVRNYSYYSMFHEGTGSTVSKGTNLNIDGDSIQ